MRFQLRRSGWLRSVWDNLATSLWFVPIGMTAAAFVLAALAREADVRLGSSPDKQPWFVYVGQTDDARDVLSTLLSSMINMTALVFSVTMVVLTLAANQFGPRLVRNFMASLQTQFVLGTFVMTIMYCLLVLPAIGFRHGSMPLPFASVSLAVALVIGSLVLLIAFIHSLARSIMSETVVERVGREMDRMIEKLAPASAESPGDPRAALPADFESNCARFGPTTAGYVQAIEFESLVGTARDRDVVLGFYFQPGDYVLEDGGGIAVFPRDRCTPELTRAVADAVTLGVHRTPTQDLDFSIRHLAEIAVRALSPGTNDPYTAVAVLHRLSASLCRLMGRALPPAVFRDDLGLVRVVCPKQTYAGLLSIAFDQIRQNGADKPLVAIHLLEAIARLAPHAQTMEQLDALGDVADQTMTDAERSIPSAADRTDVQRRHEKAIHALDKATSFGLAPNRSARSRTPPI